MVGDGDEFVDTLVRGRNRDLLSMVCWVDGLTRNVMSFRSVSWASWIEHSATFML